MIADKLHIYKGGVLLWQGGEFRFACLHHPHPWLKKVKTERNSVEKESFIFFNKFLHALSWLCPFQRTNEHCQI